MEERSRRLNERSRGSRNREKPEGVGERKIGNGETGRGRLGWEREEGAVRRG